MVRRASLGLLLWVGAFLGVSACASSGPTPTGDFPPSPFLPWADTDPLYTLYPGDEVDVIVYSAPELSRTLVVGPDGRIVMPLAAPVMAAERSIPELEATLRTALSKQVRDPVVEVTPRRFASQQVFVTGEVNSPGVYTMPGPIGALEAITLAGGMTDRARSGQVAIIRRSNEGGAMLRVANLKDGIFDPSLFDGSMLRRFDIVVVPRKPISDIGLFVQQYLRDALPINFAFSYALNDTN